MGRMTYVKALMCLLFPSAALVARAQHPVAGDLKCKLTGRMLMDGGVYLKNDNLFGNGTEFNDLRLSVTAAVKEAKRQSPVLTNRNVI
jgi:phosphate-selective porin OprO/OprP